MAAHERPVSNPSIPCSILLSKLAAVLPNDVSFKIYHLSTPPTRTSAIYSAPPNTRSDRTYCESHFLAASISLPAEGRAVEAKEVLVYAIEILVYSTAFDTTFFVSKADSTGYLHLLKLPKGTSSPIKDISSTFLRHLLETHERPDIRSVVSLFARAQDQYLFPGSVEYTGKHVLDDRGLVRWWCKVLDPVVEKANSASRSHVQGYLVIPGLESYETRSYIPRRSTPNKSWTIGNPMRKISRHPQDVPLRCLIPHFPDDPKARYLDELDEETTKGGASDGHWKSVRSIDQFWEMMAFRQECSAGRLVGFIWIVFEPEPQQQLSESAMGDSQATNISSDSQTWDDPLSQTATPATSSNFSSQINPMSSPIKVGASQSFTALQQSSPSSKVRSTKQKKKKLTGRIIPRQPRIKTENKNYLLEMPESTAYYSWKSEGHGQVILDESDYKRATELLLHLDFANLELASSSSKRWINEVRSGAWGSAKEAWGQTVTGTKMVEVRAPVGSAVVTPLSASSFRKQRKESPAISEPAPQVHVLSVGAVRKKAKV